MRCGTDTQRDIVTISRRVKHEGLSFLTMTLPNFCKDFERSLEQEYVDSKCFLGFKRHRALPRFLGGLLSLVFDTGGGRLLSEPSEEAILCIRQVCLMYKKVNLQCSLTRTKEAFNGFIQCDHELDQAFRASVASGTSEEGVPGAVVSAADSESDDVGHGVQNVFRSLIVDPGVGVPRSVELDRQRGTKDSAEQLRRGLSSKEGFHDMFDTVSRVLWTDVFGPLSSAIEGLDLRPKHGPGATAERIRGNSKYALKLWHERLEPYFPFTAFGIPSLNAIEDEKAFGTVKFVEPGSEQPVRVISVPKTLRAPRIIAIEPVCMQYTQQALATKIMEMIQSHPLTAGRINFSDQSINRELARTSSLNREYGTIDLSDASDRVHVDLVLRLLQAIPTLSRAVMACRSSRADLGDGRIVHLNKFASMGSALCFPIESMVFFTICIVGRLKALSLQPTVRNVSYVARRVFVYGDDLIVPSDEVPTVARALSAFALKVNASKTFKTGKFRESCGMDAYNGVPVTPVYARTMPPSNRQSSAELVSYVSFANQLYKAGWWMLARRVREVVETILGPLPTVQETAPCLGWHTMSNSYDIHGWNDETHAWKVKAWVVVPKERDDLIDGYPALMKCFLLAGESQSEEKLLSHLDIKARNDNHLLVTVQRGAVNIKRRWVQPY